MVYIDGYDVAPGTARAFYGMRDGFGQRFPGCQLLVSDGRRSDPGDQRAVVWGCPVVGVKPLLFMVSRGKVVHDPWHCGETDPAPTTGFS